MSGVEEVHPAKLNQAPCRQILDLQAHTVYLLASYIKKNHGSVCGWGHTHAAYVNLGVSMSVYAGVSVFVDTCVRA